MLYNLVNYKLSIKMGKMLHIQLNMIYLTDSAEKNNMSMDSGIDIFWGEGELYLWNFYRWYVKCLKTVSVYFPNLIL